MRYANVDVFRKGPALSRFGRLIQPLLGQQNAQENMAHDVGLCDTVY